VDKSFRFVIEQVENTVFFIRRENSPKELIPDVRGYGHRFLEEYTSWGKAVAGSESHQRIIQYQFGGLRLLVRFESDGYIRKGDRERSSVESSIDVDDLTRMLKGHPQTEVKVNLHIQERGCPVQQDDIIDIKTRSRFDFKTRTVKEIDKTDIIPRLWVSQIPTLVVGYHDRGLFKDIHIQHMRDEVLQWERDNELSLRKLVSLLRDLLEYARTSKTRLEICRSEGGPLEIRRLVGEPPKALPLQMILRWNGDDSDS
jgi:hypothetical protein